MEVKKIYIKGKRYIKFVIGFLMIYSAFLNNLSLVFLWLTLLFSTICHWFSYDLLFSNNNSDWHKVIALIYISPSHVLYIIFYYFFFFSQENEVTEMEPIKEETESPHSANGSPSAPSTPMRREKEESPEKWKSL